MIDGLFKRHIDPLWERAARPLARYMSANQVTTLGLVLVVLNCGAFLWHGSTLWFGIGLAISFAADALDGAVARLRDECSLVGGYYDAMIDRYQELVVLGVLATATGAWLPVLLALSGSFITSYAKARTAVETPINNDDWPDIFERQERIIFICGMLLFDGIAGAYFAGPHPLLVPGLWILAVLTHATAVQRMLRARRILLAKESGTTDEHPRGAPRA